MRLSFRLMSVRSEKVDETQQRIGGLDELNQFVIIIGGNARSLNKTLYKAVGRGSTDYKLNLQTKYYTNSVTVSIFSTLAQFLAWKSRNMNPEDIFIGALFAIIENEADQLLNEFYIHKLDVDDTQIQSKALVLPTDDMAVAYERCMEWCTNNGFEMVYLRNSEENKSEAVKNKEKLGEARLVELLEIVDWPIKKMETPRLTGHLRLDQVINILESMSDSEDDDIDVIPNEQDKAGILEFLGVYNRKDNGHNGISHGNGRVVEASVDVNVALKGGIISLVSVSGETDGGKKGKGNKGKNGNKGNAANNKQGRRNKEEGNSRMTGGNAVETIRQLPNTAASEQKGRPSTVEMEDETEEDGEGSSSRNGLGTLMDSLKEIRSMSTMNGWEEDGVLRVGGAIGLMDKLCKEMLGEEGLMEEVMRIDRLKREGKYVESEDTD